MLTGSEKGDSGCLWAGRGKVTFLIFFSVLIVLIITCFRDCCLWFLVWK